MFMKHDAPNRCEPSRGERGVFGWGGVRVGVLGGVGVGGGSGWGVRVDVNKELKFWGKLTKKKFRVGGLVGGQGGCERNVGGRR